jgi:hypothetical protein
VDPSTKLYPKASKMSSGSPQKLKKRATRQPIPKQSKRHWVVKHPYTHAKSGTSKTWWQLISSRWTARRKVGVSLLGKPHRWPAWAPPFRKLRAYQDRRSRHHEAAGAIIRAGAMVWHPLGISSRRRNLGGLGLPVQPERYPLGNLPESLPVYPQLRR